jgi:hypothetical protein
MATPKTVEIGPEPDSSRQVIYWPISAMRSSTESAALLKELLKATHMATPMKAMTSTAMAAEMTPFAGLVTEAGEERAAAVEVFHGGPPVCRRGDGWYPTETS